MKRNLWALAILSAGLAWACAGGVPAGDAQGDGMVDAAVADADAAAAGDQAGESAGDLVDPGPSVGSSCTTAGDCGGAPFFCADNFPGGYCMVACDSQPCPVGAWCGTTSKGEFCYATCEGPGTCRPGYKCSRSDAPHCVPAQADIPVYGTCASGADCSSGTCITVDCTPGPCTAGFCTQACDGAATCPAPGFCANFSAQRFCARPCDPACPEGQSCHEGNPASFCAP